MLDLIKNINQKLKVTSMKAEKKKHKQLTGECIMTFMSKRGDEKKLKISPPGIRNFGYTQ